MNITSIGQNIASASLQNGKDMPSQPVTQLKSSSDETESSHRKVDMRNISLNEINQLIKSGVNGLLDRLPLNNYADVTEITNSGNPADLEYLMNQKYDVIGNTEKSIEFAKSIGKSTEFLEKVLANLNRINGMEFPPKIDITA